MRRHSERASQMVISEGLPHILQTWCVCSGRGSDRRGTISMLRLLSNLSIEAATLLRTGNSPLSAPELASGTIRGSKPKVYHQPGVCRITGMTRKKRHGGLSPEVLAV